MIPDFTRAAPGEQGDGGGGGGGGGNDDPALRRIRRAISYLLLRQARLAHIPRAGYQEFVQYAEAYQEPHALPDAAVDHILNVERRQARSQYGFDNLQAVYAYDQHIERALSRPGDGAFLRNVQRKLRNRLYLTQAQAQGVENWLKNIPGYRPLSPQGFAWAW